MPFRPELLTRGQAFLALHLLEHLLHDSFDVADDGNMHFDVLTDGRRINIDMDNGFGAGAKSLRRPVTRSSKRAPMAINVSQFCTAMLVQ